MDKDHYNSQRDKHMRRTSPGLDLRGHTLREIREKIRGAEKDDDDAGEVDGEDLSAK